MPEESPNTVLNAVIGAVVTIVLSFTVVSPVLGGVAAGYLQREDGLRVGALAGVIAALPAVLLTFLVVGFLGFGAAPVFLGFFFIIVGIILVPIYIIGLSALGGYLGVYLRHEL